MLTYSKCMTIIPSPFQKDMENLNPNQPPPWTDSRKPAGTGVCEAIISFTLEMALGVSVTGAVLGFTSGLTSGTVVVAILDISFESLIITNCIPFPVRSLERQSPDGYLSI